MPYGEHFLPGHVRGRRPGDQVDPLLLHADLLHRQPRGAGRAVGQRHRRPGCRSTRARARRRHPACSGRRPAASRSARPSTEPPTSSIASSTATLLPGPPTSRYGPLMSLSRPIFTGFDVLCARMIPGRAERCGGQASQCGAAGRYAAWVNVVLFVWCKPDCLPTVTLAVWPPAAALGSARQPLARMGGLPCRTCRERPRCSNC